MENNTAVITGASSGIGAAYARRLAASGWRLILVARRADRLEALKTEIAAAGSIPLQNLEVVPTDLADPQALDALSRMLAARDDIGLLINNAGFGLQGLFVDSALEAHLKMVRVHIVASMTLIHAVLPAMVARRSGSIINVSSMAAFMASPGHTSYSSTKACLNMFSAALQREVRRSGIHIQALCPGLTVSEFHQAMGNPQDKRPAWIWMTAEEVVEASLKALGKGKVVIVPGFLNNVMVALLHVPFLVPFILDRAEASMVNASADNHAG